MLHILNNFVKTYQYLCYIFKSENLENHMTSELDHYYFFAIFLLIFFDIFIKYKHE